jgi:CRP-like cAMP-binding protein
MLGRLVDELTAEAGETIVAEGEHGYEFTIIEQGEADVLQDGQRIRLLGPGDFFGELAILEDGTPRTASVLATSPLRGLVFTAHFLREIRERVPLVGERLDRVARERLERDANAGGGIEGS